VQTSEVDKSYHHGNLKEELVNQFLALLDTQNVESISLRKLAARIGVAPTAVYNHFKNKEELSVAVKIRCLDHFADYLNASTEGGTTPRERLLMLGQSYFRYSQEHATLFNFLMTNCIPDEHITDEVVAAGMRAEASVRNAVIDLLVEHGLPTSQYNEGLGAFACWAMAHGISTLAAQHINHAACLDGRWPPEFLLTDRDSIHASFEAMTEVLIHGLLAAAKR